MKKILTAALAVLAAGIMMNSCAKKTDSFVLGLDDSFPPLGFRDENNEIVGYDIDLAKEVCKRLGLEFKAQPIDWSAKEQELSTGSITCIWNGFTMTPERTEKMAFTAPYLNNAQVAVVRVDSGIKTLADLAGKKVGVQSESSAIYAIDSLPDFKSSLASLIEFKENVTALNDLEVGNLDAVILDEVVASYKIKTSGKPLVVIEEPLANEEYGIAFAKGNEALRDKVQAALEEMAKDGTVAKIDEKWFGRSLSVISVKE
ncbi:MAG: amino acid ABC transporter substrate-binding protein [Treponema sp.]|nr:amino acid ABC transporter substrate-binding protein [Spirochaetia bacterium]MDY4902385.1 amino acid ABC transporter substrate-binding protein [Treponema sp.]